MSQPEQVDSLWGGSVCEQTSPEPAELEGPGCVLSPGSGFTGNLHKSMRERTLNHWSSSSNRLRRGCCRGRLGAQCCLQGWWLGGLGSCCGAGAEPGTA